IEPVTQASAAHPRTQIPPNAPHSKPTPSRCRSMDPALARDLQPPAQTPSGTSARRRSMRSSPPRKEFQALPQPPAARETPPALCPCPCGLTVPRRAQNPQRPPPAFARPVVWSASRLLQKTNQRFCSQREVLQVKLLVRRVQVIVRQSEAHHHARQPQVAVKVAHNRNRPARADEHCVLAPHLMQRPRSRLNIFVV